MEKRKFRVTLRINSLQTGGTHCIWRFALKSAVLSVWDKRIHGFDLIKETSSLGSYHYLGFWNRRSLKYENNTPIFIIEQSYL